MHLCIISGPPNEWLDCDHSPASQDITTETDVPLDSPYLDSNSIMSTPQANSPFTVSTNPSTPASIKSRKCKQRKDKGNIRRRHEKEWIDSKRKINRNLGKDYTSRNGTQRAAKKMGARCPSTCRMKWSTKISEEQRQHIFDSFWSLGDRTKQWEYLAQFALRQTKRRIYTDRESKRKYTIKYHLPSNTHEGLDILQPIEVCKKMFLGTFSVSEQLIYTSIDKKNKTTGISVADQRGKHGNQRRTITNEVIESVCNHIKSLKPVESHYTRKDSDKLYLDGSLTYRRLFELYNEWDGLNAYTCKAQTERQYHDIANDNFKLCFHIPKKDQCDQCHVYKNLENPSTQESEKYSRHIQNKTQTRQMKSKDKQEAQASNGKIVTASFDFQKILNAPHGEIGVLYYKRKLSVFNFTVYSLGEKEGTCFMWQESQGRRGANEVASCLLDFIKRNS
ncbi:uncharacterized protein LOC133528554 isoform X1 [Cydia pomonella]|uniref:uncharacterized protein LOC133528554 isoform X1 n=2 Tax=Cydia pomonella TaxID=82600 RepID=UPI002ADDBA61|nr:uncharacterized protein LOC133528554 isoform X1 [Cydia pomonella]